MRQLNLRIPVALREELEQRARREKRALTEVTLELIDKGRAAEAGELVDVRTLVSTMLGRIDDMGETHTVLLESVQERESKVSTALETLVRVVAEIVCVSRHLAYAQDPKLLERAQADARKYVDSLVQTRSNTASIGG